MSGAGRQIRVGDYRWRPGRLRAGVWTRWDGLRHVRSTYPARPEMLADPREVTMHRQIEDDLRRRLLDMAVDLEVRTGARIVDRSDTAVTIARPARVSNVAHFLLTLMTGGVWGFVWIAMCLTRKERISHLQIDAWGNIWPVVPLFSVQRPAADRRSADLIGRPDRPAGRLIARGHAGGVG